GLGEVRHLSDVVLQIHRRLVSSPGSSHARVMLAVDGRGLNFRKPLRSGIMCSGCEGEAQRPRMSAAELIVRAEGDCLILAPAGTWTAEEAPAFDQRLGSLDAAGCRRVRLDLGSVKAIDTVGAWLLSRTAQRLKGRGLMVEFAHIPP